MDSAPEPSAVQYSGTYTASEVPVREEQAVHIIQQCLAFVLDTF